MPVRMILSSVKCRVRHLGISMKLDESGGASIRLRATLQPDSEKLRAAELVVPKGARAFESGDAIVERRQEEGDAQKIFLNLSEPVEPQRQREVQLTYSWPNAAKVQYDGRRKASGLKASIAIYGTPFASALSPDLSAFTVADRLSVRVEPPEGYQLEGAMPTWDSPDAESVTEGVAEWIFRDVGAHRPAAIDFAVTEIAAADSVLRTVDQLSDRFRALESGMDLVRHDLSMRAERISRLEWYAAEQRQQIDVISSALATRARTAFLYGLAGLGIGAILVLLIQVILAAALGKGL